MSEHYCRILNNKNKYYKLKISLYSIFEAKTGIYIILKIFKLNESFLQKNKMNLHFFPIKKIVSSR